MGAESGVVITEPMTYELGWIEKATNEVGLEERPTSGSLVARFTCGLDEEPKEIRGSVIGVLTPINKKVTVLNDEVAQTEGVQDVAHFEGSPTPVSREILSMGGFWPSGVSDPGTFKIEGATIEVAANKKALEFVTQETKRKPAVTLLTGKGSLAPGAALKAFSSNLVFETTAGNLECEENEVSGTLATNGASKDTGDFGSARLQGDYDGVAGACKTSAAGPAAIEATSFPWPAEFNTKGGLTIKGAKKVAFAVTFTALEGPDNRCTFEASKLSSTFTVGREGEPVPLEITTTDATFKLNKKAAGDSPICPTEGKLSGTWTTSSGGEALDAEL